MKRVQLAFSATAVLFVFVFSLCELSINLPQLLQ